jgi:hypothetical protein
MRKSIAIFFILAICSIFAFAKGTYDDKTGYYVGENGIIVADVEIGMVGNTVVAFFNLTQNDEWFIEQYPTTDNLNFIIDGQKHWYINKPDKMAFCRYTKDEKQITAYLDYLTSYPMEAKPAKGEPAPPPPKSQADLDREALLLEVGKKLDLATLTLSSAKP